MSGIENAKPHAARDERDLVLANDSSWFVFGSETMFFRGLKSEWWVTAQSCREEASEAFAGQQAQNATSFYLFDEASAIPDRIFEVSEGGLVSGEPMVLMFGNPTRATGRFQRACFGSERERWIRFSVDSRTAKFTNKQQIAEWVADYGEDSDFVRVRVRGECPRATADQLIPFDVVAACRQFKAVGYQHLPKILAVDVARYGDDRTVLGLRQGRYFRILAKLRGLDNVEVAHRVIAAIESEKPDATVVDGDGLGSGVVDIVKHRNCRLHEFHGGLRAFDADAFFNRRAECWV